MLLDGVDVEPAVIDRLIRAFTTPWMEATAIDSMIVTVVLLLAWGLLMCIWETIKSWRGDGNE